MQNNILHTLREASHVGEKAIFHFSFPEPPPESFRPLIFQKKFMLGKLVLTKQRGLIWYVTTIYYIEKSFFHSFGNPGVPLPHFSGGRIQ